MLTTSNSRVSDAGLIHLKDLTNLRSLELMGSRVSDAGLGHLIGMKRVAELYLARTDVTDNSVAKLKADLPNCNISR